MGTGAFNLFAWPLLVVGLATFSCGLLTLFRERASSLSVSYCIATVAASVWLLGYAGAYSSGSAEQALPFTRVSQAGAALIAPALFSFTVLLLRLEGIYRRLVVPTWSIFAVLAMAALFSDAFLGLPYHYSWGYYSNYRWLGTLFMVLLGLVLTGIAYLLWKAQRESAATHLERRRARLLLIAFMIGFAAVLDFVPAYGIPLYPLGYVPVLFLILTIGYTTWRYRLVPVTPGLAARQIIEAINDILVVLDREGIVRVANPQALTVLTRAGERPEGKPIQQVLPALDFDAHRCSLELSPVHEGDELSIDGVDGKRQHLSVSVSLRRDGNHQPLTYVYLLHDITERKEAERRLDHLAHHDQLTGLANRASFLHHLFLALERAKRHGLVLGVLAVDLDGFKEINDGFGHSAGDALLRDVASRLRAAVRTEDLVARLGGDEFIVLAAEVGSPGELAIIAQRLLDTLGASRIGTTGIAAKGSVGIALYPQDGESADELLNRADFALYHAKNSGKGCYHFFDSELESVIRAKQRRLDELKKALESDELAVYYQPQVSATGAVVGVEALVRWNHPTEGLLAPGAFIPLAEEVGIMPDLDAWVMRRACQDVAQWRAQGLVLRLALNVSAQSVGSALATTVAQVLEESALPPEALELELTETALLNANDTGVVGVLQALADLGVQLSIDDFGTGYGSLVYLRSLPINAIKIDRCFVQAAPNTPQDAAIVRSLLELGRTLELRVIGEGVETTQQLELLQRHGCEALQGYWFSPPVPAAQLLQYIGASRPTPSFASSSLVAEDAWPQPPR